MKRKRAFGELELAILAILKSKGEASVKEVHQALGEQEAYTTVMTVMSRLAQKGELERRQIGRQYLYWIPATQAKPSYGLIERLKRKIFGGQSFAMIRYLLDSSQDMTPEELEHIQQLIEKAKHKKDPS